ETRLVAAGDGYPKLRRGFRDLLFERWYATLVTTKYLAGAYTSRDHRGDPNSRPPFVAVSAARQREALAFIADAGLGENVYQFRPALLNKLAPERWWHWGVNPFSEGRIDFPLHDWALAFQGTLVRLLTDPEVLSRVRDAELRAETRNQMVTIPDILTTLTASIWAEAGVQGQRARNTTSIRRDLQRLYLARLLRMVVTPDADGRGDAELSRGPARSETPLGDDGRGDARARARHDPSGDGVMDTAGGGYRAVWADMQVGAQHAAPLHKTVRQSDCQSASTSSGNG